MTYIYHKFINLSKQASKEGRKEGRGCDTYLNNHLQVKLKWDFNKKSTPRPIIYIFFFFFKKMEVLKV